MGDENVPPSNILKGAAHKPPGPPIPDPASDSLFFRFMNSTTPRARLGKFALLITIIFTVVFVANAAIVGVCLHSVSEIRPKDLKLERVAVSDLCDDAASLELKGSVKKRNAFDFFLLSSTKTTQIKVSFPEAKDSNGRNLPHFVSITIPPFLFGRGNLKFDFTGPNAIKISPNKEFKLKYLAEYLLSNSKSPKKIALQIEGALETSSFWIPVSFDRKDNFEFVIDPKKASGSQFSEDTFSVDTIELLDQADANNLEIKVNIHLSDRYVPKFLNIDVPAVGLEIGYKKPTVSYEKIFPVASITIDSFILSHFSSDLMFRISLNRTHKDALLDLLRKVKNGVDDVELAIRGMAFAGSEICKADGKCRMCGFQRLINTLEVSKPYPELARIVPLTKSRTALSTRVLEAPEIMCVGLIGVQQAVTVPRFNFEVGISKDFISKAINYDIRKIRGKLPPLALKNILESSHANATLAKLDIEHLGENEDDAHVNFSVSISFIDAYEASKFAAHLAFMGIESPAQMMDEIGNYRRLYFKGIEDTLFSSIASIYEIDLPLSRKQDKKTNFSGFNVAGYSFLAPSDGASLTASHSIAASLIQNERRAELNIVCKLNKEPLVKNPIVRFYWGDLDVTFHNQFEESQVPLAAMTVSRGQYHLSLSPNNPLHLIHNGIIQASIHTNVPSTSTTLQLLDAWKALLSKVANSSEYTNIQAIASISGKSATIELAVPPYSVIESNKGNQFGGSSKFVKKSQLRVVGLRGSTIQALLKLPAMNTCPVSQQILSSIVSFEMSIPRIEANLCSSKDDASYNLMKVGIYPMKISGSIVDRCFCDLKIEMHYQNHDQDTFVSQEPSASEVRSNWIPLSATIIDFEKLLEVFDETAVGTNSFCLTTCKDSEMEKGTPLLNMIINYAGSSFKFKAPSSPPRIEPVSRPAITNFMNDKPVKLELRAISPYRHQLEGSFKMVIPVECLPHRNTEKTFVDNEEDSMMCLQWGAVSIEIQDGRNVFKVNVSQGQVEIRLDEGSIRLGHRSNSLSGEFTNSFEAKFQVSLENKDFNSADIRRFIHNIYSYGHGEKASFIAEKNMGSRTVLMKASMQPFVHQADTNKSNNVANSVVSSLHFKTLISLMKAMAKRAGSRPSHLDDLWSLWRSEVELLKPPQPRKVDFPCLLPSMCVNGLLYEPSNMQPVFPMKIVVSHFVQLMCESIALGIGRMLSKLDLASHPRKLQLSVITESDAFVASSVNDIDIVEAHVRADYMAISRVATIIYPDEVIEGSEVLVQQVRDIMEDRFTVVLDLSLPKYYHDVSGLIHHIAIDPLFRMVLDPIPKYTKLTENGEEPAPMYQSPLNAYASTERIAKSNLLSTLSCVLIAEMPMGSIVSALGSATLNVSSCLGVNGKPSSSVTTLLEVDGMSFPNPSARVNMKMTRPFIGTYLYKRDEPLPSDPVEGFHIASGRVEPIPSESFPLIFEASTNHPILLYGSLSYSADGLDPNNPNDRAIIQNFASRAALGKEMQAIMELDLVDNLMIRMKLDYPPRDFELSFFDAEHSSPDARSINKVTQGIYEMSKKISNAMGTAKEKWGSFKNWIWASSPEQAGDANAQPVEENESKPSRPPAANPQTGGQGYTDFNFALSLRNPADFTMAVNTLNVGVTIDDNDGFIQSFPVAATDKKIRGTLLLAQHKCHPFKTPSAQTLEEFLRCAHENPSRELFPNEHLLDNSRLLAPVAFEKKINYAQAVDEIVNHDGLCLDIEGTFSLGILDNGDGRFPLDLPVEVKRVPIPRVSFAQKPITEESKKNIKYQADFDPCFKLKKNTEIGDIHEIYTRKQLWYSLAHDLITTISPSSPLMIAGRSTKSHVASLMMNEQISFESSVLYEFTFEFKASIVFRTYPGFAFIWHANEKNSVVGSGEYGYAGIEKSVGLAIHPYRFNSIKLLHNGELGNVLYEKRGAVFPKKYHDRKMHVSLRYLSFDRRFILDVQGDGDDFVYHSIINIEREPDDSPLTRGPSLSSMVGSPSGWFGITANSTGALDIIISSFKINAIEPKLEKTKVFWPNTLSALPGQEGHFVIRLTDHADFAMAQVGGDLRIKLCRINSLHPRSVIEIPDERTPAKQRSDKASLLQFPSTVETECTMRYRPALGLYDVFYKASLPGRYAILMSYEDGPWTKVQWSTIYVRHVW